MPKLFDKDEVLAVLAEAGRLCRTQVKVYMVGGGAMAFRGDKQATKDVDLVVGDETQASELTRVLTKMGLEVSERRPEECKALEDATILVETDGMRVDLFVGTICGALRFSDGMRQRSEEFGSLDNVTLYVACREDIFLLKSVTGRGRDIDDMAILFRRGLRRDVILAECHGQSRYDDLDTGRIWEKALFDKLEEMEEEYEIDVPWKRGLIKSAAAKTAAHYVLKELQGGPLTAKEIAKRVGVRMSDIEPGISLMEKTGKVEREPFPPFRLRLRVDSNKATSPEDRATD